MQPEQLEALAGEVARLITAALTPVLARVTALEARPLPTDGQPGGPGPAGDKGMDGAAGPSGDRGPEGPAGSPGRDGRDGVPGVPGVPGEKGAEGRHGVDGVPGKDGVDGTDGVAGLSYEGVYQDGQAYDKGQLVSWAGSGWHCNEPTTTKPGDGSKAWTLMIKRGRDGRDGVDAPGALPVVKVGGGR